MGEMQMIGIKNGRKGMAALLCSSLLFSSSFTVFAKEYDEEDLKEKMEQIIDWKKSDMKQSITAPLLANPFLKNAGNSVVDWYPFGMGRAGYPDDYDAYIAIMDKTISERYKEKGQLSANKATEWHRMTLAYLAAGGDATNIDGHNLIADGVYNRGKTADLGVQGINGLIWGLLALDALRYDIPENAYESRADLIKRIMALQLQDGSFSLNQKTANVDLTAMAISALAPYYNSSGKQQYTLKTTNKKIEKSVREVVEQALSWLSENQQNSGDFSSEGTANLESTAQVAVALTALQIDVEEDERFIKNDHTVIDAMMNYENEDGGFIHAKLYDEDNPTSQPNKSNSMASEQALYAFVALYRAEKGERTLFDFRKPQTMAVKNAVYEAEKAIARAKKEPSMLNKAIQAVQQVPKYERSYISNYASLEQIAKKQAVKLDFPSLMTNEENGQLKMILPTYFEATTTTSKTITASDVAAVKKLLEEKLSTEQQVDVEKYRKLLTEAENKASYTTLAQQLGSRATEIQKQSDVIKQLNEEILATLYPFSKLKIADEEQVKVILQQYNKLSSYDQKQIVRYEDVEKSMAQIESLKRERLYKYLGIAVVSIAIILFALWKRKRRKSKEETE